MAVLKYQIMVVVSLVVFIQLLVNLHWKLYYVFFMPEVNSVVRSQVTRYQEVYMV